MQSIKLSFLRHYPYALTPDDTLTDHIRSFGVSGDTITLSFSIIADEDLEKSSLRQERSKGTISIVLKLFVH